MLLCASGAPALPGTGNHSSTRKQRTLRGSCVNGSREEPESPRRDQSASRDAPGVRLGVNVTLGHWAAATPGLWMKLLPPFTPRGSLWSFGHTEMISVSLQMLIAKP